MTYSFQILRLLIDWHVTAIDELFFLLFYKKNILPKKCEQNSVITMGFGVIKSEFWGLTQLESVASRLFGKKLVTRYKLKKKFYIMTLCKKDTKSSFERKPC